ncbi:MAG: dgkA [Clostridiales bacterium]|jgi:diacylglycerol kinase|nr:dgkA [Clostridiales bacterium]
MKNRNFTASLRNALHGILYCIRNERNIRTHIIVAVLVLALALIFDLTKIEITILIITIGFVIVCEIFNTAIEVMADLLVQIYHPKIKIIKDLAAGAVLISALISMIIGTIIFFDKVLALILNLLSIKF